MPGYDTDPYQWTHGRFYVVVVFNNSRKSLIEKIQTASLYLIRIFITIFCLKSAGDSPTNTPIREEGGATVCVGVCRSVVTLLWFFSQLQVTCPAA